MALPPSGPDSHDDLKEITRADVFELLKDPLHLDDLILHLQVKL